MWRSNQLSYRTGRETRARSALALPFGNGHRNGPASSFSRASYKGFHITICREVGEKEAEPSPVKADIFRNSRKEVFQPHLPVRLPCYDLAPITGLTLGRPSRSRPSGTPGFHGLTGGVYKARERIHRAMADARLLANPASWSRVADSSPN